MSDLSGRESNVIPTRFAGTALSTTRLVKVGNGMIKRIVVNSHTTGAFRLFDGTATGLQVPFGGTFSPATGSSVIELEAGFDTGLFIMVSGTIDTTVVYI